MTPCSPSTPISLSDAKAADIGCTGALTAA
jgi:hypothetical protein